MLTSTQQERRQSILLTEDLSKLSQEPRQTFRLASLCSELELIRFQSHDISREMQTPEAAALAPSLKYLAPQQEYLLQGSILDTHRDALLHRLKGLCDNAESNFEQFADYEAVFMLRNSSTTQQSQYVLFRVRHSLDHPESADHIRYVGQAEMGDRSRPTLVRACLDVACSSNVKEFLQEMGFRMDHDYVTKGFFFHKGRMKVTVFKIYRLIQPGKTDPHNQEPLGQSNLVELSVVAPLGQEQIGEDMKNFADQLKPLVVLEKFDHRRIQ